MDQTSDEIMRQVGAANVMRKVAHREGHAVEGEVIKLCDHEVQRHAYGVWWSDPAFRTAEGLGVGSTLAAFDTTYGEGEAVAEEGNGVRYFGFFLNVPDVCYGVSGRRIRVDRTCRVTGISLITKSRE